MELNEHLQKLQTELKEFVGKQNEELKNIGSVTTETKTALETLRKEHGDVQKQLDAIQVQIAKPGTAEAEKSIFDALEEKGKEIRDVVKAQNGHVPVMSFKSLGLLEQKTLIDSTALGNGTPGVIMPQMVRSSIVPAAEQQLRIRDILPTGNTTSNAIFYLRENAFTNAASPQVEGSAKAESALTFTTETAPVRTIAHWIPVTRQAYEDMTQLASYINRKMVYGLKLKEDEEILKGSGSGLHLEGLITVAQAYDTGLNAGAWNKADVIRRAMVQVELDNESPSDFVVLNPRDWADIELTKATTYEYVAGNAFNPLAKRLWGIPVVTTNAMTAGKFLVGASMDAQIWDRMGVEVAISTEHASYFIENKVAIRVEERLALAIYRPDSFVYGDLSTSPA